MNKSKELATITDVVKDILTKFPETRNSDDYLYCKVCERVNAIYINLPFWKVLINRKKYGYPSTETVGRARRKIQSEYPELSANSTVSAGRMLNEEIFREYARGNV